MNRKVLRAGVISLLVLSAFASTGAGMPAPAPAEDQAAIQAREVIVFAYCEADGSNSWNAVGTGFTGGTRYTVSAKFTWSNFGGGGGSSSGNYSSQTASAGGFVSTPTYYGAGSTNRETYTVKVTIGGVSGTDSANCD